MLRFEFGGQVPRHHEPSFRPHARSVAQFPVHERFVALGSYYPHLRTRLGFSPSTLVRDSGQHTHAKTTTFKLAVQLRANVTALRPSDQRFLVGETEGLL